MQRKLLSSEISLKEMDEIIDLLSIFDILPANSAFSILFDNFDTCLMAAWFVFPFVCLTVMM